MDVVSVVSLIPCDAANSVGNGLTTAANVATFSGDTAAGNCRVATCNAGFGKTADSLTCQSPNTVCQGDYTPVPGYAPWDTAISGACGSIALLGTPNVLYNAIKDVGGTVLTYKINTSSFTQKFYCPVTAGIISISPFGDRFMYNYPITASTNMNQYSSYAVLPADIATINGVTPQPSIYFHENVLYVAPFTAGEASIVDNAELSNPASGCVSIP
jgi:hypothetical protein